MLWWKKPKPAVAVMTLRWLPTMDAASLMPMVGPFVLFALLHVIGHGLANSSTGPLFSTPHIFGHFCATLVAFSWLAYIGFYGWLLTDLSSVDRIGGYHVIGEWIAQLQFFIVTRPARY